jgi:hypothetical protein
LQSQDYASDGQRRVAPQAPLPIDGHLFSIQLSHKKPFKPGELSTLLKIFARSNDNPVHSESFKSWPRSASKKDSSVK